MNFSFCKKILFKTKTKKTFNPFFTMQKKRSDIFPLKFMFCDVNQKFVYRSIKTIDSIYLYTTSRQPIVLFI